MVTGFEITDEDVIQVLVDMGRGAPPDLVEEVLDRLDHAAVEQAALHGDELEAQTRYAHDAIAEQVRRLGL